MAPSLKSPYSQGLAPLWMFTGQDWRCSTASSMHSWAADPSLVDVCPSFKAHFHQEGPIQVLVHGSPCSSSSSPLLSRNCGSSRAPTSSIGSVLTLGCSNTTRVHFACSIFLVGLRHSISWLSPGAPVTLGRWISRSSCPCAQSGQGTVCIERSLLSVIPPGYCKVLGLSWDLHQEEGFQS